MILANTDIERLFTHGYDRPPSSRHNKGSNHSRSNHILRRANHDIRNNEKKNLTRILEKREFCG